MSEEKAKIERRPVDRPATAAESEAFKERSFEVRETAEEPVVSKQARGKEEVVVGKETVERTAAVKDTARRTDVEVERTGQQRGLEDVEYERHFSSNYAGKGERFDAYRSAYHYAEAKSTEQRFSGKDWTQVEEDIHQDWERSHPGTWAKVKEAIHYGWNRTHQH